MDLLHLRPDMKLHPMLYMVLVAVQSVFLFVIWVWKKATRWDGG